MEPRIDLMTNETAVELGKRFAAAGVAIHRSSLPASLRELVALRTSQINGCGWCVDMHVKEAVAAGESPERLGLVAVWRETTVFDEAERAALALAEEGTRLADAYDGVSDETWSHVRKHYDEDETVTLVYLVALTNAANRLAVMVHQRGGSYRAGMFDRAAAS